MENINEEKIKTFKKFVEIIKLYLRGKGINPILTYDGTKPDEDYGNSMSMSFRFKKGGLKRWHLGIWGCGEWSETYDCNSKDYISIFLIHDWYYDKFKPTYADVVFEVKLYPADENEIKSKIEEVIQEIDKIHKHPIIEYHNIFNKKGLYEEDDSHDHEMPCIEYFRDWWSNEVVIPFTQKLKMEWSVVFLYGILRLISIIDPRVNRGKLFYEKDNFFPKYVSGFLASEWASDCDWAFNSFAWLYAKLPYKLCKLCGHRLFDAHWNVADFPGEITNTLEKRMWRGVVI